MATDASSNLNVCFCIPAFKASVSSHTTVTLVHMVNLLRDLSIDCNVFTIDGSEIVTARNILASHFYDAGTYSHLFFLDDDMVFEPEIILDMLRRDKPIIGAVAPKRLFHLDRFHAAALKGGDIERSSAEAVEFVLRHDEERPPQLEDGMMEVAGVGMATTLIKREVFKTMLELGAATARDRVTQVGSTERVYGFYDNVFNEKGQHLSEDFSFCQKWRKLCGGEVWMLVDQKIGHIGPFTYQANYQEILKQGRLY